MSRFKAFAFASCVGLLGAAFVPSLNADQWNKKTILTVNESIQIPNKVLAPGKYVMKLLDSPSNRHIVQIYDESEQHLVTTVLAIPNYRLQPTGETQFGFWETPAGQPKAMRSWFYPGDNFGQEFAYPKNEAMTIAATVHQSVPTTYAQSEADLTTARVASVDQAGTEKELDRETYAKSTPGAANNSSDMPTGTAATQQRSTPTEVAQNRTTPEATPAATPSTTANDQNSADRAATPAALPATASPYPMIGLIGLLSIAAFGLTSAFAKRGL